jgi:hypothetical protein
MTHHFTATGSSEDLEASQAGLQAIARSAWRRINDALNEMAAALQYRIDAGGDIHLEPDLNVWCDLADAICDLSSTRRKRR